MPNDKKTHRQIMADLLQMLQRELTDTLRPELQSSYALHVNDALTSMLDYMQEWVNNQDYPEINSARQQLVDHFQTKIKTDNEYLPEFEDTPTVDETLATLVSAQSKKGDMTNLKHSTRTIAEIDERLYSSEATRHEAAKSKVKGFLAEIDVELTKQRADNYLGKKLGISNDPVQAVKKIPGGYSKDTFLLELQSGNSFIVRRDFPFGPVDTSAPDEFDLLAGLFQRGFPVAKPIAAEYDKQYFGQPFLVVEKIEGQDADHAAKDNPEAARFICLELARLLAELHQIPPKDLGFDQLFDDPREQVRLYLQQWRKWWDSNRIHPSSLGEAAFAWLERNIPEQIEQSVVIHGDARPGNMLYHQNQVSALLDWEFAHPGDAAEDLLYAKGFVEPYLSWDEFLAAYLQHGGVPISEASQQYYEIFRSLRNVICTDVAWSGFVKGKYPVFKLAAQGVLYKRMLAKELAISLKNVSW